MFGDVFDNRGPLLPSYRGESATQTNEAQTPTSVAADNTTSWEPIVTQLRGRRRAHYGYDPWTKTAFQYGQGVRWWCYRPNSIVWHAAVQYTFGSILFVIASVFCLFLSVRADRTEDRWLYVYPYGVGSVNYTIGAILLVVASWQNHPDALRDPRTQQEAYQASAAPSETNCNPSTTPHNLPYPPSVMSSWAWRRLSCDVEDDAPPSYPTRILPPDPVRVSSAAAGTGSGLLPSGQQSRAPSRAYSHSAGREKQEQQDSPPHDDDDDDDIVMSMDNSPARSPLGSPRRSPPRSPRTPQTAECHRPAGLNGRTAPSPLHAVRHMSRAHDHSAYGSSVNHDHVSPVGGASLTEDNVSRMSQDSRATDPPKRKRAVVRGISNTRDRIAPADAGADGDDEASMTGTQKDSYAGSYSTADTVTRSKYLSSFMGRWRTASTAENITQALLAEQSRRPADMDRVIRQFYTRDAFYHIRADPWYRTRWRLDLFGSVAILVGALLYNVSCLSGIYKAWYYELPPVHPSEEVRALILEYYPNSFGGVLFVTASWAFWWAAHETPWLFVDEPFSITWWLTGLNLLGSIGFFIGATFQQQLMPWLCQYMVPNWPELLTGYVFGSAFFLVGSYLMIVELASAGD